MRNTIKSMKDKIMNGLINVSTSMSTQKYMVVIKNAFTKMLPVIIIGSFGSLFSNLICSTKEGALSLANIHGLEWLSNFSGIFDAVNYATMNLFAIIAVCVISYELCSYYKYKDKITSMIISLGCYVSLCARQVSMTLENGDVVTIADALSKNFTGVQGLFFAMILAIVVTEFFIKLSSIEKLKIKMPSSVPSNIAEAFSTIIPGLIVMFVVSIVGNGFELITGISVFDIVSMCIQKPLTGILTGLPGYLLVFFMTTLLWFFGIHGTQVLKPVYQSVLLAAIVENADNIANGIPATNILNEGFRTCFSIMGGAGCTIGLIFAILVFSKREDYRSIVKLAIPCSIFNINEPIIFGLPIVLNPILGIPFMLAPIVSATIAYFLTQVGLGTALSVVTPFTTPVLLNAFINSNGHIGTVIVQLICIIAVFIVYSPFVIACNKMEEGHK